MGRGSRSDTSTVTLREPAITSAPADVQLAAEPRQIGIWRMEPLPERDTLRAADAAAPRDAHANLAKHARPDWSEDRGLADHQRGVAVVFDGMGGYNGGERASEAALGSVAIHLDALPEPADMQAVNAG